MKSIIVLLIVFIFISCSQESDDDTPLYIEPIFTNTPEKKLYIDVIYVVPSTNPNPKIYHLNETEYINHLNGSYFHRNNIGFVLGKISTLVSDELYDLRDNRNSETSTFLKETKASYNKGRLNLYIMKRCNTIAIAGIGMDQRALITDEHIHKTTSPHEIGHALGLHHTTEEGNIMSMKRPYLRKEFNNEQIKQLKKRIDEINQEN